MDAQTITARMLTSLSSTSSVRSLLLAFGVTNPAKTSLPPVFNLKYDAEWRTFIDQSDFAAPDHETRMLFTILEFIRYMRYNRRNPFVKKVIDPVTHLSLNPEKVYKRLVVGQLQEKFGAIEKLTKKYALLSFLTVKTSQVHVSLKDSVYSVLSYSVLRPKSTRDTLDSVLQRLGGTLYSGQVPVQLLEKVKRGSPKSSLPTSKSVMTKDLATLGWLPLYRDSAVVLSIRRTSDGALVFRTALKVTIHVGLGNPTEAKAFVARTWKALKSSDKL